MSVRCLRHEPPWEIYESEGIRKRRCMTCKKEIPLLGDKVND